MEMGVWFVKDGVGLQRARLEAELADDVGILQGARALFTFSDRGTVRRERRQRPRPRISHEAA